MDSTPRQDKSFLLSLLGQPSALPALTSPDVTRSSTESPALSKPSITRSLHDDRSLADTTKPQFNAAKIFEVTNDRQESPSITGSSKPSTPPPAVNEHQDLLSKLLSNLPTHTPAQVVPEVPDAQPMKNAKTAQKRKKKQPKRSKHKPTQNEAQPVQKKRRTSELDFDALLAMHEKKPQPKGLHNHDKPPSTAEPKLGNMSNAVPADILSIANQVLGRNPKYEKAKQEVYRQSSKPKLKPKQPPRKEPLPPMRQRPECRFFKVGKCKEGGACRFQHVGESMRQVCRHFKTGSCNKGNECNFLHDLSIEPCRFYHLNSLCEAGDHCQYSHKPLTPESRKRLRALTGPCKFYHLKGFCTNGDGCAFAHDTISQYQLDELKASVTPEEAPKPCAMYHIHGRCSNGSQCSFSHAPISVEERDKLMAMFAPPNNE